MHIGGIFIEADRRPVSDKQGRGDVVRHNHSHIGIGIAQHIVVLHGVAGVGYGMLGLVGFGEYDVGDIDVVNAGRMILVNQQVHKHEVAAVVSEILVGGRRYQHLIVIVAQFGHIDKVIAGTVAEPHVGEAITAVHERDTFGELNLELHARDGVLVEHLYGIFHCERLFAARVLDAGSHQCILRPYGHRA